MFTVPPRANSTTGRNLDCDEDLISFLISEKKILCGWPSEQTGTGGKGWRCAYEKQGTGEQIREKTGL